jgi:DNA polymerase V
MESEQRTYVCIDLKSFYASVECVERGLDPFECNLVVADPERTKTTICLAISPAMKALGVKNRCRVYEIPEGIDYIMAPPRMRRYMEVSTQIYGIYLTYVSAQDVHVYSVDECFIDATPYLRLYDIDAKGFARMLMDAVYAETGICATAGIGTNLFLAKVALDVTAKHAKGNIGCLDEASFKDQIWFHRPITDIWNIGPGIARRLAKYAVYDLAGVCAMSEVTLYKEFGKNAELLIDHAWGQEPCTIEQIHSYNPKGHSISSGQVLPCDYSADEARIVLKEMVDACVLDLVKHNLCCRRVSLSLGYSGQPARAEGNIEVFDGGHGKRYLGKKGGVEGVPHRVSATLNSYTSSANVLQAEFLALFNRVAADDLPIKKINIAFDDLAPDVRITPSLFDEQEMFEREYDAAKAVIKARGRFGKNAVLKAASLQEKATARERNNQVGGHKA